MLTERTLHLINAELDGELEPGERAELDAILETSADARAMKAELQKLGNLLGAVPQEVPPEGLRTQILDQLAGPERKASFSLSGLFSSFQPATAGVAFAAGLLATVAVYEWAPGSATSVDTTRMVGTMMAGNETGQVQPLDSLSFDESGVAGEIGLLKSHGMLLLEINIQSAAPSEIEVALGEAGLRFGGLVLDSEPSELTTESYEVSGGTLRVVNQGRQAFTVLLPMTVQDGTDGREIRIGISSGEAPVISGVLRG